MYGYIIVENRKFPFAFGTLVATLPRPYWERITQCKRLRLAPSNRFRRTSFAPKTLGETRKSNHT